MTNAQMIFSTQIQLVEAGTLGTTGRMIKVSFEDGTSRTIPEPLPIHTFKEWKTRGYSVKKGEHAIARISLWMPKAGSAQAEMQTEDGTTVAIDSRPEFFLKESCFFASNQVERRQANA